MFRKKILKAISYIALAGAFLLPVQSFAQDSEEMTRMIDEYFSNVPQVTGRARALYTSQSEKLGDADANATSGFRASGRLGAAISTSGSGSWSSSASIEGSATVEGGIEFDRDTKVVVGNDAIDIRLGYLEHAPGVGVGPAYDGPGDYVGLGDSGSPTGRFNGVSVSVKSIENLSLYVGVGSESSGASDKDTESTTGLSVGYNVGDLTLGVMYGSMVDSNKATVSTDAEINYENQTTKLGLRVAYSLGNITPFFAYRSETVKAQATEAADLVHTEDTVTGFALGLNFVSDMGTFTFNYTAATQTKFISDLDKDVDVDYSDIFLGYLTNVGGTDFFVNYGIRDRAESDEKSLDTKIASNALSIGLVEYF